MALYGSLEAVCGEAREVIQELHGLLKDVRTERRLISELVEGAPRRVEEAMSADIERAVKDLGEATQAAMDVSVKRVHETFDEFQRILTGTDRRSVRRGQPGLGEMLSNLE